MACSVRAPVVAREVVLAAMSRWRNDGAVSPWLTWRGALAVRRGTTAFAEVVSLPVLAWAGLRGLRTVDGVIGAGVGVSLAMPDSGDSSVNPA